MPTLPKSVILANQRSRDFWEIAQCEPKARHGENPLPPRLDQRTGRRQTDLPRQTRPRSPQPQACPTTTSRRPFGSLKAEFDQHHPDVIVGSSRGGAVAMNIDSKDTPLVLLCPAWKKWGTAKTIRANSTILHSRADDVVPFADSEELVRNSGLPPYTLVETGNDHRLADPESLELMLEACRMGEFEEDEEELDILEKDWTGLCYTAALTWAKDAEEDWLVVHGTVWSDTAGKRIEHAWCEREGFVVDLALPAGSRIVAKEAYYRAGKPEVRRLYSADEALELALRNRHDGPWEEKDNGCRG